MPIYIYINIFKKRHNNIFNGVWRDNRVILFEQNKKLESILDTPAKKV